MKISDLTLNNAKQRMFNKNKKGDRKSKEQSEVFVNRIYNTREDFIQLFSDYTTIAPESRYRGKGIRILTSKQVLQRLSIALA